MAAKNKIADLDLHDIAAAQFAIDGEIEQCSISQAAMLVEEEPYSPDLPRFQRALGSDLACTIPRSAITNDWIEF
jgi:hypothetical protein